MKHVFLLAFMLTSIFPAGLSRSRGVSSQPHSDVAAAVAPEWPRQSVVLGSVEVRVTVTLDGYFGNVVDAQSDNRRSSYSEAAERAARLWKFFPTKPNTKRTLTFVFDVFPKDDHTRRTATTFVPPYKVVMEGPED